MCLFFCGCSKNKTAENIAESQASTNDIDMAVAAEISELENVTNFSDETIKALSVVVRTNLLNNETKIDLAQNEYNSNINQTPKISAFIVSHTKPNFNIKKSS